MPVNNDLHNNVPLVEYNEQRGTKSENKILKATASVSFRIFKTFSDARAVAFVQGFTGASIQLNDEFAWLNIKPKNTKDHQYFSTNPQPDMVPRFIPVTLLQGKQYGDTLELTLENERTVQLTLEPQDDYPNESIDIDIDQARRSPQRGGFNLNRLRTSIPCYYLSPSVSTRA